MQFNCVKKKLHEKLNWIFSGTAQVSHQVCQFFCQFCVSSCACDYAVVCCLLATSAIALSEKKKRKRKMWSKKYFFGQFCRLMRVTLVDKNKAVVCCLLATSVIMLSEKKNRKRKMWSTKWYLKSNTWCDAHLLNELLEKDVPWDDAIVVSAGKLRKTVGLPEWTAQFSVWKTTGKDSSEVCASACQNGAVYSVFPSGMTSHSKIAQFNWECIWRFTLSRRQATPQPGSSSLPCMTLTSAQYCCVLTD